MIKTTFKNLHEHGAKKHGALWFLANQRAVELSMGYNLDYEKHKQALSHIVLWILDAATASPPETS